MKKLSIIFCICTLLLCSLLAGCGSKEPAPAADHKLRVVVTFNAMKEFAQAVGQDKIHITSLIPDGTEPHDFQPTTKTMQALSKADILIYNLYLIHIRRCRRTLGCRSRWSPYH